jgi:hypothetical protein
VDGGAHENERSIEGVFVAANFSQPQVNEAGRNNFVFDALFLARVVDAHVSNNTEAELGNLGEPVLQLFRSLTIADNLVKLPDGVSAKERFNTRVAKCDVDEGFEEVDQVLGIVVLHIFGLRVSDERQDHELGDSALDQPLATVLIDSETLQGPSRGLPDSDIVVFEQFL